MFAILELSSLFSSDSEFFSNMCTDSPDIVIAQANKTGYFNFRSHTSSASRGYSITFSLLTYPFTGKLKDKLYAL